MDKMPVQKNSAPSSVPIEVYLRAYEVYCEVFGAQEAIITGNCRGGFGIQEIISLLYARSFPREQWKTKFKEAIGL